MLGRSNHAHVGFREISFLVWLVTGGLNLVADSSISEGRFKAVEQAEWSTSGRTSERFVREKLPPGLLALLAGYNSTLPDDGTAPILIHVRDLNGDGVAEYFVMTQMGGSGGPHYFICGLIQSEWRILANVQGSIYQLRSEKKWSDLISVSRGGGGLYLKQYLAFKRDGYVVKFSELYNNGRITRSKS